MAPPWSRKPTLTLWLIGINVGIFVFFILLGFLFGSEQVLGWEMSFGLSRASLAEGFYWTALTYMFVHANLLHLFFNMVVLYFAGREVERTLGNLSLLLIFFGGGLLAGLGQVFLQRPDIALVGASGGTFAVLLAFTRLMPNLPLVALILVIPVRMKAKFLGWGAMLSSLLFMFTGWMPGIGHLAHFIGGLVGLFYVMAIEKINRPSGVGGDVITPHPPQPGGSAPWIDEEIDRVLDKISREGMHSLDARERQILMRGRERIARKTYFNG